MQKKRQLKTCIVVVVLMCLLTISMTFQTICVKTISDNYINSLIVNQIIDLIIDEETDANFQQINQLQNKIKKSDALYQLNRYAFDQSMRNTNKNKIKLDQKELQKFSTSCKKMIKDELNISIEEKIEAVVDPATIDVTLSKKVTKSFTIQPELLVGSNQKVTDFETPTLDVMTVKITASQNQLNSIRIVKALIDCTGQIQDFEANAALAAYDAKGNRVNVTLSPETVHASVKLAKNTSLDKEDSE